MTTPDLLLRLKTSSCGLCCEAVGEIEALRQSRLSTLLEVEHMIDPQFYDAWAELANAARAEEESMS